MELKFEVYTTINSPLEKTFDALHSNAFLIKEAEVSLEEKKISLDWNSDVGEYNLEIVIDLLAIDTNSSLIKISEKGWPEITHQSISEMNAHSSEWTQILCSLKKELEGTSEGE